MSKFLFDVQDACMSACITKFYSVLYMYKSSTNLPTDFLARSHLSKLKNKYMPSTTV